MNRNLLTGTAAALAALSMQLDTPEVLADSVKSTPAISKKADAFVKAAHEIYEQNGNLPYVWGGESPKSYSDTTNDQFFADILDQVTRTQPPGSFRSGKPTEPGFDCSGFVWYAGRKAGLDLPRETANGYLHDKRGKVLLSPGKHSIAETKKTARPGDLIFICDSAGVATHVAVYEGNGKILESAGKKIPDYDHVPTEEWKRWGAEYDKQDQYRGGLQESDLSKYRGRSIAVERFLR